MADVSHPCLFAVAPLERAGGWRNAALRSELVRVGSGGQPPGDGITDGPRSAVASAPECYVSPGELHSAT